MFLAEIDERLAWATQERPGPTQLLEHVLSIEAAHKVAAELEASATRGRRSGPEFGH